MAVSRQARAGFTLVELMIALVAGAFAVSGVYYLNGMSSRMFSEQMRVSETQMSLRSAMEQLRRELSRAGYLHTPSSMITPDCSGGFDPNGTSLEVAPRAMRALHVRADGSLPGVAALLDTPATNRTRADVVDTWGNYATADAYLTDPVTSTKTEIRFQTGSESFRRSFVDPTSETVDKKRFESTFVIGRMLRVEQEGRLFFRTISAVTFSPPTYSVTIDSLPWCFDQARWTAVAPIVHYRYGLEPDTQPDLARLRPNAPPVGVPNAVSIGSDRALLVRREWNDATDTAVANTARVVLDYAVEFAVEAFFDTAAIAPTASAPSPTWTPTWALMRGANVTTQSTTAPYSFRSLVVTLSSRSGEADPRLPFVPRARFGDASVLDSALLTFRVLGPTVTAGLTLNARVRTMRSEIFLQNL